MKAIGLSSLENCLSTEQTNRLHDYLTALSSPGRNVIRDWAIFNLFKSYVWTDRDRDAFETSAQQMKACRFEDGSEFCRSMHNLKALENQLDGFRKQERSSFLWNEHAQRAFKKVQARYATFHLKTLEYRCDDDILKALTNLDTSAGWSRVLTGKRKKKDYIVGIFKEFQAQKEKALENGSFGKPILVAVRTNKSKCVEEGKVLKVGKMKARFVNIVDIYPVIGERMWAKPLTDRLKYYQYTAIGKSDARINEYINRARGTNREWLSLDFKAYDSTIPSWMIHAAFKVISSAFDVQDASLLKVLENDFREKNIIVGDGVEHFTHGNPSGSGFTAIVNGIVNEIITETWLDWLGWTYDVKDYMIMGDDNLIFFRRKGINSHIDEIASYISHNFGIECHPDKCQWDTVGSSPEFLSRSWTWMGAERNILEIISLMIFPEHWRKYRSAKASENTLTPALLLYAYILAYPVTMRKYMDVDRFLREYRLEWELVNWTPEMKAALPYRLRCWVEEQEWSWKTLHDSIAA